MIQKKNEAESNRRIDFVKLGSGRLLGHEVEPCEQYEAKAFMMWLTTCRYCFCYCDAPGPNSDRYFSLRDVTSNITENKYPFTQILILNSNLINFIRYF